MIVLLIAAVALAFWQVKLEEDLKKKRSRARLKLMDDQSPAAKQAFVKASREYYAFKNQGKLTAYDEQRIANDLEESLPHPTQNIGEYHDKRTIVSVEKAVLKTSEDSPVEIQKGIMLAISSSADGRVTMPELLATVTASQERIEEVLGKLMIKGLVKITNKENGSICYALDDLA